MSPVSPSEIRAIDEQMDKLFDREPKAHWVQRQLLTTIVRMIWEVLKREHGWR